MAQKQIAWNTGTGNIILTYTGQGDGSVVVTSDDNTLGSARSQVITVETVGGAITRNLTVQQAACPFPVGQVRNYSYTGSYQEVELPAGTYKLQCWGAQGGSNGTNSTYGITAQAGGKGGYSEGVLTLTRKTTVRVYVGGQGSSSSGGYNGGGSTTGTSQYNASNTLGYSKMGGGGGATDIRLSDGDLLSRMIVAGGGSGGAMCYKAVTTTTYEDVVVSTDTINDTSGWARSQTSDGYVIKSGNYWSSAANGLQYKITVTAGIYDSMFVEFYNSGTIVGRLDATSGTKFTLSLSGTSWTNAGIVFVRGGGNYPSVVKLRIEKINTVSHTTTDTSTDSQVGYAGGGTAGGGYSSTYQGKQNAAGTGGSFGQGANQSTSNYRYCSGAGGGGWYGGGGGQKSDSSMTYCKYIGGGSGFVNTAESAGNRPSGYTGLELDSGETRDGATSFPNTAGTGNETGHSGNGYAKITRLS